MRWNPILLVFLLLLGCAADPAPQPGPEPVAAADAVVAERSAIPDRRGSVEVAQNCTLWWAAERMELACQERVPAVASHLVGVPAVNADGTRVAWSHRPDDGDTTRIEVVEVVDGRWSRERVLVDGPGRPDRVALDPAGTRVAYVGNDGGIAALFVVPFAGGEPVQLTNLGLGALPREPGQPPPGFVPVPHRAPPVFDGDTLRWEAEDGPHAVELP